MAVPLNEFEIWNRALSRIGDLRITLEAVKTVTAASAANPVVLSCVSGGYVEGELILVRYMDQMTQVNGRVFQLGPTTGTLLQLRDEDGTGYTAETSGGTAERLPNTKLSRSCYDAWSDIRDEVFRSYPWNSLVRRARLARLQASKTVTAATAANPVVITTSAAHGYSTGDEALLERLGGMVELNDRWFTITVLTTTTFSLGVDGTLYTAYTTGGTSKKALQPFTPDADYGHRYTMPSEAVRVLELVQSDEDWTVEGREVLTDAGITVPIRYLAKILDVTVYDPLLVSALAARLAAELCEEFTQSNSKRELAMKEYEAILRQARVSDAREQSPMRFEEDRWIRARL